MGIPGLKDLRTTLPGIITVAAGFVLFSPELFPDTGWGLWITQAAKYIWGGGMLAFGINAASTKKVKEKTAEMMDAKIERAFEAEQQGG